MSQGMGLDDFLNHSTSNGGGGYIVSWKKRKPARIDTWMHTKGGIVALWRHGWTRLAEVTRDNTKVTEVWGADFNCWESEDVLRLQHKRLDDDTRRNPPKICPMCLLIEWLRDSVRSGVISWTTPVFKFSGTEADQEKVLTAAGMYNGYSRDDLTRGELAELRKAGIRRDEAWKENSIAKCHYVFSIVDNDDPTKGVMTAVETTLLGDCVKKTIRDQMDSLGELEGHPLRSPYAIRWEHHPEEKKLNDKYRSLAMPKLKITPEIQELITDAPVPDLTSIIEKGNIIALRSVMEQHALIDMPFDEFFAVAERIAGQTSAKQAKRPESEEDEAVETRVATPPPPRQRRTAKAEPKQPDYPPGTVMLPCDACKADMAEDDEVCWNCGAKYEVDVAPPPVKAAPKATTPKAQPKSEPPPARASEGPMDDAPMDDDGDPLPF